MVVAETVVVDLMIVVTTIMNYRIQCVALVMLLLSATGVKSVLALTKLHYVMI